MSIVGETLYNERIKQGLTVSDISKKTNIRKYYIVAIEEGNFDSLPGNVYTKGFITNYAKVLGLDAKMLISEYNNEINLELNNNLDNKIKNDQSLTTKEIIKLRREKENNKNKSIVLKIIIFSVIVILIGSFIIYFNDINDNKVKNSNYSDKTSQETSKMIAESNSTVQNKKENTLISKEINLINLKIEAKDKCWTEINVDGENTFYGMLTKGQKEGWSGKKITIKLGNINAVEMKINNKKYLPTKQEIKNAVVVKEFNSSIK